MGDKARDSTVDVARGIGIVLVVLGHASICQSLKGFLFSFHMPLFFILSGVAMSLGRTKREFWDDCLHRAKTLLLPYSAAAILFSSWNLISIPLLAYGSRESIVRAGGVSSLWFLPVLFVSSLIVHFPRRWNGKLLAAAILMAIGFALPHFHLLGWPFGLDVALVAAGFILLGCLLPYRSLLSLPRWASISLAIGSFVAVWMVFPLIGATNPPYVSMWKNSYGKIVYFLICATLGSCGVLLLSRALDVRRLRLLAYVGRCSLWIFILHRVVLRFTGGSSVFLQVVAGICLPLLACESYRLFLRRIWPKISSIVAMMRDSMWLPLVLLMPRNPRKVVFGAWLGRQYSCNPRYLFEYFNRRGGFDCVWIGDANLRGKVPTSSHARFAVKGSLAAVWHCLTARFFVYNVKWQEDIMNIPICRRVIPVYLTHGTPSKKTGVMQLDGHGRSAQSVGGGSVFSSLKDLKRRYLNWLFSDDAWTSVTSSQGRAFRLACMPFRLDKDRMIECGTPRFDFLLQAANDGELKRRLKEKFARLLCVPSDREWWLYVPTWRHDVSRSFSFATSKNCECYQELLDAEKAVLIEKQHPLVLRQSFGTGGSFGSICVVTHEQSLQIDMQELLLAADRLITDYSSVYYDYYLIGRPVIHFAYDYDYFMKTDMGFNYDLREYNGGPFAYSEAELIGLMRLTNDELIARRSVKTREHLEYETGHSCQGYYDLLIRLSNEA